MSRMGSYLREELKAGTLAPRWATVIAVALVVFVSCYASIELTRQSGRVACVWFANALLLSLLLKAPSSSWPTWLVTGLVGNVAADVATGDPLGTAVPLSLCNSLEIVVAGGLFRLTSRDTEVDLTRTASLIWFMVCSGVGAAVAAVPAALTLHWQQQGVFGTVFRTWVTADALGFLIVVPLLTSTRLEDFRPLLGWPRVLEAGAFVALLSALTVSFLLGREPAWLFLLYPIFVASAVRHGFAGAAAVVLLTTATGMAALFVAANQSEPMGHIRWHIVELQGLILSCVLTALPVSSLLAEVRRSESRVREFFARHYVPMWFIRARDGLILEANQAAVDFYGYGPGLVGMHVWEINQVGKEAYLQLAASAQEAGRGQWVFPHRLASGELRQVQVSTAGVVVAGEPLLLSVMADLTDRLRAEEELQRRTEELDTFFATCPDLLCITDLSGQFLRVNGAWEGALGYPATELLSRNFMDLVHPDDRAGTETQVSQLAEGRSVPGFTNRYRGRNGDWRWLQWESASLHGLIYAAARDISERTEAERQLREVLDTLEQRVEREVARNLESERILMHQSRLAAMGEMVGAIAHQWRQPLNALNLILVNLQEAFHYGELTPEQLEKSAAKGNQLIQKMSSTINDFRDFYRPNREPELFSVKQQAQQSISLVDSVFHYQNISLDIEVAQDSELFGFPQEYSQVLLNLLNNAREAILATGQDRGRVLVSIDREGRDCWLRVRDNGGGIDASILEHVFDPYFTTRSAGTGLGLYLSKTIVERKLNGRLSAQNIPGGAELSIVVPLPEGADCREKEVCSHVAA